jgi:hypothetical protein
MIQTAKIHIFNKEMYAFHLTTLQNKRIVNYLTGTTHSRSLCSGHIRYRPNPPTHIWTQPTSVGLIYRARLLHSLDSLGLIAESGARISKLIWRFWAQLPNPTHWEAKRRRSWHICQSLNPSNAGGQRSLCYTDQTWSCAQWNPSPACSAPMARPYVRCYWPHLLKALLHEYAYCYVSQNLLPRLRTRLIPRPSSARNTFAMGWAD